MSRKNPLIKAQDRDRKRLERVRKELEKGRVPFVRKPLPGLYDLLEKYGVNTATYPFPIAKDSELKHYERGIRKRLANRRYFKQVKPDE